MVRVQARKILAETNAGLTAQTTETWHTAIGPSQSPRDDRTKSSNAGGPCRVEAEIKMFKSTPRCHQRMFRPATPRAHHLSRGRPEPWRCAFGWRERRRQRAGIERPGTTLELRK